MDLTGENYVIARNGLKALTQPALLTSGLRALVKALGLHGSITHDDVAYSIGPCLNAVSRLDDVGAVKGVELLMFNGPDSEAAEMAKFAISQNETRKVLVADAIAKALDYIDAAGVQAECPLLVRLENCHEGIIGIIAGKLADQFKVPVCVLAPVQSDGMNLLRGSMRTCGNYNVIENLTKCTALLYRFGGHPGAGGLSLIEDNFQAVHDALQANLDGYISNENADTCHYDLEINADQDVIFDTLCDLRKYGPFGQGNPEPVFLVKGVQPLADRNGHYHTVIGKKGTTVKIKALGYDAIAFDGVSIFSDIPDNDQPLDMIGKLSDNVYNGNTTHQINVIDVRPSLSIT